MNGEQFLYTEIAKTIAYAVQEYDIGQATVLGVLHQMLRETEIGMDRFIEDCLDEAEAFNDTE